MALVLAAGCGDTKPPEYGKRSPSIYKRVVSLSPSATEICATAFVRIILGRTAACNSPGSVRGITVVTDGLEPDLEKIKGLKPDCIVYDRAELSPERAATLKPLGIPIFEFGGDSIEEFTETLFAFGRVSGAEERGSTYVDKILLERDVALADRPKHRVKMAIVRQDAFGNIDIADSGGFVADVVGTAGGVTVGPAGKGWSKLDVGWLAKQDPQVIVVAGPETGIVDDARLIATSAGKNQRVFQVDPDLPTRRGSRVDRFIRLIASLVKKVPQTQD